MAWITGFKRVLTLLVFACILCIPCASSAKWVRKHRKFRFEVPPHPPVTDVIGLGELACRDFEPWGIDPADVNDPDTRDALIELTEQRIYLVIKNLETVGAELKGYAPPKYRKFMQSFNALLTGVLAIIPIDALRKAAAGILKDALWSGITDEVMPWLERENIKHRLQNLRYYFSIYRLCVVFEPSAFNTDRLLQAFDQYMRPEP